MPVVQKTLVNLADYPFQKELQNRLFLATCSKREIEILRTIIDHSLTISISFLSEEVEIPVEALNESLEKLKDLQLYKINGSSIVVDREMRKFFLFYLQKFEEGFQPDLNHLQSLLIQLPIHSLPEWYSISRTSDNIFLSIVEHYFRYPKVYRYYLDHLEFQDPKIKEVIKKVYSSKNLEYLVSDLEKEFQLSREEVHKIILLLELHFSCFLVCEPLEDGSWNEWIVPIKEWKNHLNHFAQRKRSLIDAEKKIVLSKVEANSPIKFSAEISNPINRGAIQRELLNCAYGGWIFLDDFINNFSESLSKQQEGTTLERKGRGWSYTIPKLSKEEIDFLRYTLINEYASEEVVSVGTYEGSLCITLTESGYQRLR